ncbi:PEP-CTERM sorting domain-containing protein [Cerasicoccus fimbriatus]|uniref:PEP-CTERM sorting domain-containing protein n=1 Tax=Cerasicoccus fimbriatus TaxID=3014554 RepID=UPI0022B47D71|nr:PEP-CTERM sorting domain-containing protein [Cerasicoccus sp. TK19100]
MLSPHLAIRCITISSAFFAYATAAHAVFLYQDSFSGSSATALNTTAPVANTGVILGANHGTSNANWNADVSWKADGSNALTNDGSAFLPFTPQNGFIYDLSLQVDPTAGGSDWMAIAFTQSANASQRIFDSGSTAWMLQRADRTGTDPIQTFTGPGTAGGQNYNPDPDLFGFVTLHVQLDTTQPNWRATWYVDEVGAIRTTHTYGTNPTINYIGFGKFNSAIGTVDNLSLTVTAIPEPSEIAAIGLAMLGGFLFWRRRAKRQTVAE